MKKKGNLKDPSPPPLKKINWPKISLESIKTIWRIDSIDHFLSENWAVHSYSGLSKQVFVILPSWLPDSRRGTRAGGAKYRRARFHERARFQRWLEQECGHHHGTLERAESSEIAANRSPPVLVWLIQPMSRSPPPRGLRLLRLSPLARRAQQPFLSLYRLYLEISKNDLFVFHRLENWEKLGERNYRLDFVNWNEKDRID